jgi:hypothetical protein
MGDIHGCSTALAKLIELIAPQPDDVIGLDTNCCYGGWLTALDVDSGQLWQVDEQGEVRA